jgi:hypothetical protein
MYRKRTFLTLLFSVALVTVAVGLTAAAEAAADEIIDADGIATPQSGDPAAREVQPGDPLTPFPDSGLDAGLDMFDQDGNQAWTQGVDDLHVEDPSACPTALRNGVHDLGADCKVLDINGDLANGEQVDCDISVGFSFSGMPCPPPDVTFHDADNNGAWSPGEDLVLDVNGNRIFDDVEPPRVAQHFRAYRAMGLRGTQEPLTLVDQFGPEQVRLGSVRLLMTPVEKRRGERVEPIQRPDEHLKCYRIRGAPYSLPANRTVTISNQFRDATVVRVGEPRHLCTPASKAREGSPGEPPADLNHYKCYRVSRTPSVAERIGLSDQFASGGVLVRRLIRLCNPVEKRREGREPEPPPRPSEHLACYRVREPLDFEPLFVRIGDQFRLDERVQVTRPSTLCVPSRKTEGGGEA